MDYSQKMKLGTLIQQAKVLTLGVSENDIPWCAPVYFVSFDEIFFFFSNQSSKHITYAADEKFVSASIFHDGQSLDDIFGVQMSGRVKSITGLRRRTEIINRYVDKFHFLKQSFGERVLKNPKFFLSKFNSHLYGFYPEIVFYSDNSKADQKREMIDLDQFKFLCK